MTTAPAPTPRYELTVVIKGNTHAEMLTALTTLAHEGYQTATQGGTVEAFTVDTGIPPSPQTLARLRVAMPDQSAETYALEVAAWQRIPMRPTQSA